MPPEKAPARGVVGQITRGTTNTNRLRRIDRWIARHPALRRTAEAQAQQAEEETA